MTASTTPAVTAKTPLDDVRKAAVPGPYLIDDPTEGGDNLGLRMGSALVPEELPHSQEWAYGDDFRHPGTWLSSHDWRNGGAGDDMAYADPEQYAEARATAELLARAPALAEAVGEAYRLLSNGDPDEARRLLRKAAFPE